MMGSEGGNFGSPYPWKMHFQHTFYFKGHLGLVIKYLKSHHPIRCIKVGNKPPKAALFVVHIIFFLVTRHDRVIWSCLVQTFPFYV